MLLRMFLNLDRKDPSALAIVDDSGERLTYGDLCDKAKEFKGDKTKCDKLSYSA